MKTSSFTLKSIRINKFVLNVYAGKLIPQHLGRYRNIIMRLNLTILNIFILFFSLFFIEVSKADSPIKDVLCGKSKFFNDVCIAELFEKNKGNVRMLYFHIIDSDQYIRLGEILNMEYTTEYQGELADSEETSTIIRCWINFKENFQTAPVGTKKIIDFTSERIEFTKKIATGWEK